MAAGHVSENDLLPTALTICLNWLSGSTTSQFVNLSPVLKYVFDQADPTLEE